MCRSVRVASPRFAPPAARPPTGRDPPQSPLSRPRGTPAAAETSVWRRAPNSTSARPCRRSVPVLARPRSPPLPCRFRSLPPRSVFPAANGVPAGLSLPIQAWSRWASTLSPCSLPRHALPRRGRPLLRTSLTAPPPAFPSLRSASTLRPWSFPRKREPRTRVWSAFWGKARTVRRAAIAAGSWLRLIGHCLLVVLDARKPRRGYPDGALVIWCKEVLFLADLAATYSPKS